MTRTKALLIAAALAPGPGQAAEPQSAIPWLSESVVAPPPAPASPADPADAAISVRPLEAAGVAAVGLLPPAQTGLPKDLWGPTPAAEARALLRDHPARGVPAARALFRTILLAEADPPKGGDPAAGLLLARIDRLLDAGALEEADALLTLAGPATPDLFRRWFDVGLLLDRAEPVCASLRDNPGLSTTLPARVFCLARGGDWNAAEITLTLGHALGEIPPGQKAELARFLDPALFEDEPDPPPPEPFTALDFVLREAVGLPRPQGALPLAFLHGDLSEHAPMRARIDAAERLVLSGAARPAALFAAYRAGAPAASGGVWERAGAVQALDAALDPKNADALAEAVARADTALSERGLRVALAREFAPMLARIDAGKLPDPARQRVFELLLLGGEDAAAARAAGPAPGPRAELLLGLAGARPAPEAASVEDARARAALNAFGKRAPSDERAARLAEALAEGRTGETLIEALDLLAPGGSGDPAALQAGLFALNQAGLEDAARRIAIETLLLSEAG